MPSLAALQPVPGHFRRLWRAESPLWRVVLVDMLVWGTLLNLCAGGISLTLIAHTVAGLALEKLGRIPAAGDWFEHAGYRFEIVDMDGRRIDKLLVQVAAAEET